MKEFYISDCTRHENKIITSNFVVVSKQIKPKKSGSRISLDLRRPKRATRSQDVGQRGRMLNAFEQDDFVKVKGLVNKYKNRFQLTVHKLRELGETEIDFSDYLPRPPGI